jgi:hypothetical protein
MSAFYEAVVDFGSILLLPVASVIFLMIFLALACYGFQMIRLFFKF